MSTPTPTPPLPAVDTMRIRVDGRELDVPRTMPDWKGLPQPTTMLQACQIAGVEVPHYCYHPKLPVAGNCRMCLVEFGLPMTGPDRRPILNEDGTSKIARSVLPYEPGTPRGAIACATPVSPGMEIYPGSDATRQMREAVLESLLINHPLDCPICDQAGECKLQEYSVQHGQSTSRFVETKVHKPKAVDLGPRIVLDDERCILCTRCIRFTRDVVGDDKLGIVNRGSYNTIAAYPGTRFDNNYTLNTVDICPVGALTSKDFRFQMRVWFLKETESICTSCGMGCNIVIGSRENRIHRLEPRQNDAVNSCWMCDRGRLNYKWVAHGDRLREARLRGRASGWDAALAQVADALAAAPPGGVAILAGARQTCEELYLLRKLADRCKALTDSVPRMGESDGFLVQADRNPNSTAARLFGLAAEPPGSRMARMASGIAEGSIRVLLAVGEDPVAAGLAADLLGRLDLFVVIDVLPGPAIGRAHVVLPGCAPAEKRGTFINVKGRIQRFLQAVQPPGDARPEHEVLAEILHRVTAEAMPHNLPALFDRMAAETPALAAIRWGSLGSSGADLQL